MSLPPETPAPEKPLESLTLREFRELLEADERRTNDLVAFLNSVTEHYISQTESYRAINDQLEACWGPAWEWDQKHREAGTGIPEPSLAFARVAQQSIFESIKGVVKEVHLFAQQALRLATEDPAAWRVQIVEKEDTLLIAEARLASAAVSLTDQLFRSAWLLGVYREGNPSYDLDLISARREGASEAVNRLAAGFYSRPIAPQLWYAREEEFVRGALDVGQMLGVPFERATRIITAANIDLLVPSLEPGTTAERLTRLRTLLTPSVSESFIGPARKRRPREVPFKKIIPTRLEHECRKPRPIEAIVAAPVPDESTELLCGLVSEAVAAITHEKADAAELVLAPYGAVAAWAKRHEIEPERARKRKQRLRKECVDEFERLFQGSARRAVVLDEVVHDRAQLKIASIGRCPDDRYIRCRGRCPGAAYGGCTGCRSQCSLWPLPRRAFVVTPQIREVYRLDLLGRFGPANPRGAHPPDQKDRWCQWCGCRAKVCRSNKGTRKCKLCLRPICRHLPWCNLETHHVHVFRPDANSGAWLCAACPTQLPPDAVALLQSRREWGRVGFAYSYEPYDKSFGRWQFGGDPDSSAADEAPDSGATDEDPASGLTDEDPEGRGPMRAELEVSPRGLIY